MTDVFGALLTAVDLVGPAMTIWFLLLRRDEDRLDSALTVAGLCCVLVPSLMFLLNRIFAYPIDQISLTSLAATLIAGAIVWRWILAPRVTRLSSAVLRVGRLIGGSPPSTENGRPPSP